jgi:hypothetical protein
MHIWGFKMSKILDHIGMWIKWMSIKYLFLIPQHLGHLRFSSLLMIAAHLLIGLTCQQLSLRVSWGRKGGHLSRFPIKSAISRLPMRFLADCRLIQWDWKSSSCDVGRANSRRAIHIVLTSEHCFLLSGTVNSDGWLIVEQHFWQRHFFKPWSQIWEIQALYYGIR